MQQVYNLFREAISISASLCWSVRMIRLTWLSEEGRKILGILIWSPGYCSAVMVGFIVAAGPVLGI